MRQEYPNSVFFAARLLFEREHWWNRWLHNQTVRDMERLLHDRGLGADRGPGAPVTQRLIQRPDPALIPDR